MIDLASSSPILRYERKATLSGTELLDFYSWLKTEGVGYFVDYEPRIVNSIYFDTPKFAAYNENSSGVSGRRKARLRWYGKTLNPDFVVFEIKIKKNQLGYKWSQKIQGFDIRDISQLYPRLRSQLSGPLKIQLDRFHCPVLFNRYTRQYLASNRNIRITIDTHLLHCFITREKLSEKNLIRSAVHSVVEIKYEQSSEQEVKKQLTHLPFVLTRNSKYINGIDQF